MKKAGSIQVVSNKFMLAYWAFAIFLLLLPLIGMQFSSEVNWGAFDFVVFGVMLLALGIGLEVTIRATSKPSHRVVTGVILLVAFLLVWAQLAVGIF